MLRDESANGTLVNGSRISGTYLLDHGDVLRVCDEELRFEVEGRASSALITTATATTIIDVSRLRSEHETGGTHEWPSSATRGLPRDRPGAVCRRLILDRSPRLFNWSGGGE